MRRRPAGLPPLRGRGWSDQPATVKRSQGDVEAALADAEPVGQLGGGDGPRMAGPDGVENRLLTLAESVVFGTAHARPSLAGLDTRRHAPPCRLGGSQPTPSPFYRQLVIRCRRQPLNHGGAGRVETAARAASSYIRRTFPAPV